MYIGGIKMKSKKRYKIKKLPILLAIVIVFILIVAIIVISIKSKDKDNSIDTNNDIASNINSNDTSSDTLSSDVDSSDTFQSISSKDESVSSKDTLTSSKIESTVSLPVSDVLPAGSLNDWNLILLNHDEENKIDGDLSFEKTKFDSQWVDSRAGVYYKQMYDAAKKEGITLFLRSGYRSIATQTVNYNANVQREIKRGNSEEEAIRLTNLYYTVPGHSEHHTGLAFDLLTPEYHTNIYTLDERFASTDAYKWLVEHAHEYGFILRYPKEKQNITKINFEPWHYRFVGIEHATYIKEHNLCFEEYIELLKADGR